MQPRPALPEFPTRFVLAGFMGSGKSTVGRLLAQHLGWGFVDLDDAVSQQHGISIPEMLASRGEPFFRRAEADVLAELLEREQLVIALGGGAPETLRVQTLLRSAPATTTVHLCAPFPLLFARCQVQAQDPAAVHRPLLGSAAEAEARFHRRQPMYAALGALAIDASGEAEQVVQRILAGTGRLTR